jgi:hypothetical protein
MSNPKLRERIAEEIGRLPESRLAEVFNLLHFFRMGVESAQSANAGDVMQFAGAWQDMSQPDFDRFSEEIAARRRAAFDRRRELDGDAG